MGLALAPPLPDIAAPGPVLWDAGALDRLAAALPDACLGRRDHRGQHTALLRRERLLDALRFLRDDPGCRYTLLLDIAGVDRLTLPVSDPRFEVVYHLYAPARGARVRCVVPLGAADPSLPSATPLWPAADWLEREVFDMFGVRFTGHPLLKRILCHHEFVGHALRKDYPIRKRQPCAAPETLLDELLAPRPGAAPAPVVPDDLDALPTEMLTVNLGPSHPASHGTLRVLLRLDGERIVRAVPEIGYLHRGFEKSAEKGTWTEVIPYTDRMNYNSALGNNVGYCRAVETLLGIEVPPRAQALRVICAEMARIMDHLICVGTNLVDLGALTNFWYFFNLRERFYRIVERLCGARLTTSYARIGGLARDAYPGFADELRAVLREVPDALRDVRALVERNRIYHERTDGVGAIGADDAIAWGFTGPCLRACGVPYDLRRAHPYWGYETYDFDVVVGEQGDARDRVAVRFGEIEQSVRILAQALDRLPEGPIQVDDWRVALPPKPRVYGSIEGLMGHFNLIMHGIKVPAGEAYEATEAANGELGFYCVSDGSGTPYRVRVRPPCFSIYSAFARLVEGRLVADAVAVLGGLNIVAGELDR